MLFLILSQTQIEVEEEVRAKKTRFYNIDGILGLWASERQYYRGELGIQMQFDMGFYGRFSIISFSSLFPTLKEAYVELSPVKYLYIRGGMGAPFWGNGMLLGDYLGGNAFFEVSYGKEVWFNLLAVNTPNNFFGGLRFGFDWNFLGFQAYGTADTTKNLYFGSALDLDHTLFYLKLEGVLDNSYNYGTYISSELKLGKFRFGFHGFGTSKDYKRILGQGIVFDEEFSPFMGFSNYLTYTQSPTYQVPWTDISGKMGGFFRLGFLHSINEDWYFKPSFDFGLYRDGDTTKPFVDGNIRFDWTEVIYLGFSAGALLDRKPLARVSLFLVSTYNF
jgi:hypothetical protein